MIITIIILLFCNGDFSEGKTSTEYQMLPHLSGYKCKPSDTIGTIKARSDLACAYQCFKHAGCISFFYSNTTMVCDRCSATYDVMGDVILDVEGGSVYYSTKAEEVVEETTAAKQTAVAEQTTVDTYTTFAQDPKVDDDAEDKKFEYVGCYSAFCEDSRPGYDPCDANYDQAIYDGITVERCYEICKGYSTTFAIWLLACYCDMKYDTPATENNSCKDYCQGNPAQECGGNVFTSIYRIK